MTGVLEVLGKIVASGAGWTLDGRSHELRASWGSIAKRYADIPATEFTLFQTLSPRVSG